MKRKILGPFNRVEGDLEVRIETDGDQVHAAYVNSTLFRGFEDILRYKNPSDALVYTPRICGICSVSQSVAAATALANLQGIKPALNGQLANNLILGCENAADHLSHFYLFFMPDFARPYYQNHSWHTSIASEFKAQQGAAMAGVLRARAEWLQLTGILAGKWPHSLAIQPGGTSRVIAAHERVRLLSIIASFRHFLEHTLFADSLENVLAINSNQQLREWQKGHPNGHFSQFLALSDDLGLDKLGCVSANLMSHGAYPLSDEGYLYARGVRHMDGTIHPLNPTGITEDTSHSQLNQDMTPLSPEHGLTLPMAKVDNPEQRYSWSKAPRLNGEVVEVGAVARQVLAEQPLISDLLRSGHTSVSSRVIARLIELASLPVAMEQWARQLQLKEPFCHHGHTPSEGSALGLVEAARGSLGHWITVQDGVIENYQIIAPTTWNFSPRDQLDIPGVLEQALVGAPVHSQDSDNVEIAHIVRSFDPCMVCTVH